jgi:hypothetical protein
LNVAPAGRGAAVSEKIVSPSGSVTDTVNVRLLPSTTTCVGGAVTTGARSGSVRTEIAVKAVPLRELLAVNVTVYVPTCVDDGIQLNVPDVFPAPAVNVLPVVAGELAAVREAIAWPSGSTADTVNVISVFSCTDTFAWADTTGWRSTLFTVITVAAVPVDTGDTDVAENVTVYVPCCVKLGVQLNVPDVFPAPAVNVLPVVAGELAAVRDAIAWPSGSTADTVNVRLVPSFTVRVTGAVTTGARSAASFTVITVDAVPVRAGATDVAEKVTV